MALSRLVSSASVPGVYSLVPELNAPLKGLALLAWVLAAWWLPFVVLLGVWRHVGARVPLRYDPQYWAMVFPIAMFALASRQVGAVADVPVLRGVSTVVTWFAVAVWATVLAGLLASLVRGALVHGRTGPRVVGEPCITHDTVSPVAKVTIRELRNHGGRVIDRVARGGRQSRSLVTASPSQNSSPGDRPCPPSF